MVRANYLLDNSTKVRFLVGTPGLHTAILYYILNYYKKICKPIGSIAQLAERHTCNVKVPSSILGGTLSNIIQMYYGG